MAIGVYNICMNMDVGIYFLRHLLLMPSRTGCHRRYVSACCYLSL